MKKRISRILGLIMLIIAIAFIVFALNHPEMSFPWNNTITWLLYGLYILVTDLAQAHILAVKYLMEGNESNIFNLGNGVGFTVKEVIETARKVTGKPIKAVEEGRRAGDPAVLIASSEKAKILKKSLHPHGNGTAATHKDIVLFKRKTNNSF